jgi:phage terminase small subunit
MGVLANSKHERFAQELAKGKSATEAYELAGYRPNRGNATTLKQQESISKRVCEILEGMHEGHKEAVMQAIESTEVTPESLVRELEEARAVAKDQKQGAAMTAATIGKARILGLIIEKREDVTPRRDSRAIDARILELLGRRGEERAARTAGGAGADRAGDEAIPTVPGHGTA